MDFWGKLGGPEGRRPKIVSTVVVSCDMFVLLLLWAATTAALMTRTSEARIG